MNVTVLFDAYYLCAMVARAVESNDLHYISVGKSNRGFQDEELISLILDSRDGLARRTTLRRLGAVAVCP